MRSQLLRAGSSEHHDRAIIDTRSDTEPLPVWYCIFGAHDDAICDQYDLVGEVHPPSTAERSTMLIGSAAGLAQDRVNRGQEATVISVGMAPSPRFDEPRLVREDHGLDAVT